MTLLARVVASLAYSDLLFQCGKLYNFYTHLYEDQSWPDQLTCKHLGSYNINSDISGFVDYRRTDNHPPYLQPSAIAMHSMHVYFQISMPRMQC